MRAGHRDDEGGVCAVTSAEVNEYLRDRMGEGVSAKDFRTWGGTTAAARVLARDEGGDRSPDARVRAAFEEAAAVLGNTPTVCRTCYVHPVVPEAFRDGRLEAAWRGSRSTAALGRHEQAVRRLLDEG